METKANYTIVGLFAVIIVAAAFGFIYWFAELVVCQLDGSRLICKFIGKGFLPCVVSFAIMDFVILPQIRNALKRRRHKLDFKNK